MVTDTTNYPAAAERDVLSEYDALVFDLDGVITDTAAIHAAAWKQAMDQLLARLGNHASPFDIAEDYRRHIDGRPRLEGAAAFLDSREIRLERGSPDDPPDRLSLYGLTTHKNDLFLAELDRRGVRVFPDAAALLGRLAELAMRCAVVTASENGRHVLASAGLLDRFDVTVTGVEADKAVANFRQVYSSAAYRDTVDKTLEWRREGGQWRIVGETARKVGEAR